MAAALADFGLEAGDFSVELTGDLTHGDYATNAALVLAKKAGMKPRELAERIAAKLQTEGSKFFGKIEAAGAGFINFYLSPEFVAERVVEIALAGQADFGRGDSLKGKKVMVEYTDPNPFKEFHIGHLMNNAIGESISRLIEFQGAEVRRACYQGDVGLHVAKAVWGFQRTGDWLKAYPFGARAYAAEETAKKEIEAINVKIYSRADQSLNKIYDEGREWSLGEFEKIYARLGTKFDYYFFESEVGESGKKIVKQNTGTVFEISDGAVVFRAERFNPKLHTRVFITSLGLPTYEAKELGLHAVKAKTYPADLSVIVTAREQNAVFAVGLEALKHLNPDLVDKVRHLSHGMLRLPSGKMSSRTGDVITAESLINKVAGIVAEKIKDRDFPEKEKKNISEAVAVGAVKYSILRQAIGGDIEFDFNKSISFEGDSGPYLQYSCVRAMSVLKKTPTAGWGVKPPRTPAGRLERLLLRFPEVADRAASEYAPHRIASYLVTLAGAWNGFYAKNKIIGSPEESYRLALTGAVFTALKNGLFLLGIPAPERM